MVDDTPEKPKVQKAVALKYDKGEMPAPQVVATGQGTMAEQIIKIAEEHGVHIHQDSGLVEILSVLELDSFIPLEAYAAVAEILSFLYSQDASARKQVTS